jgi:predicted XRE-type DNA-binding protein
MGCWDWTGSTKAEGYGVFWKSQVLAHRVSYRIYNGPIPNGQMIRHSCDRPICVQPAHLIYGTHDENMHDMVIRGRHLTKLTEANVRWIRASDLTQKTLAEMFGVHRVTISKVLLGKTWRHVSDHPQADPEPIS